MWHRKRWAGWAIRIAGAVPLLVAIVAAHRLFGNAIPPSSAVWGTSASLLALLVFAGGSAAGAMVLWGAHLFDEVQVSARWRRLERPGRGRHRSSNGRRTA